jgi:hypothetical protein
MTETLTALYLKVCPQLNRVSDRTAVVTDTHVVAWVHTIPNGEVISRHHRLRVCRT